MVGGRVWGTVGRGGGGLGYAGAAARTDSHPSRRPSRACRCARPPLSPPPAAPCGCAPSHGAPACGRRRSWRAPAPARAGLRQGTATARRPAPKGFRCSEGGQGEASGGCAQRTSRCELAGAWRPPPSPTPALGGQSRGAPGLQRSIRNSGTSNAPCAPLTRVIHGAWPRRAAPAFGGQARTRRLSPSRRGA